MRGMEKREGVPDLQTVMPLFVVCPQYANLSTGVRHSRGFHYEGGRIRMMPARDARPVYTPDRCTAALCLFASFSLLLGLMGGTGRSTGGSDPMCVEAPWGIVGGEP